MWAAHPCSLASGRRLLGELLAREVFGALVAGAGAVAAAPGFLSVALLRGVDKILKFTGHYGGMDLILAPVPEPLRERARTLIRSACTPIGALLASAVSAPLAAWLSAESALVALMAGVSIAGVASLALALRLRRQYLEALQQSLRMRAVPVSASRSLRATVDGDLADALFEGLESPDPGIREFALQLLAKSLSSSHMLRFVLQRRDPRVRAAGLDAARRRDSAPLARIALNHLQTGEETDPRVLSAGLRIVRACLGSWDGRLPPALIEHADPQVRAEALLLSLAGGDEGVADEARAAMREWASDPSPHARVAAARILRGVVEHGRLGDDEEILETLLDDEAEGVRLETVRAIGLLGEEAPVHKHIEGLADRARRATHEAALGQVGSMAIRPLVRAALDTETPRAIRHSAIGALSRIRHADALWAAGEVLAVNDRALRRQAAATIRTLRRTGVDGELPRRAVLQAIDKELRGGYLAAGVVQERADAGLPDDALLTRALTCRIDEATGLLFGLLGALHGSAWVDVALARYRSGSRRSRADAVELLDLLASDAQTREVLQFLDLATVQARSAMCRSYLGLSPGETFAGRALSARGEGHLALCLARAGVQDGVDVPSAVARAAAASAEHLERTTILMQAPLFSKLSGEDLAPLAAAAGELRVEARDVVLCEGELDHSLYVLVEGRVSLSRQGAALGVVEPVGAFGELAILDDQPRAATASAEVPSRLLRVRRADLAELLDSCPALARGLIPILLRYVRQGGSLGEG